MNIDHFKSQKQKESKKKQWYKDIIDYYCVADFNTNEGDVVFFGSQNQNDDPSITNYELYNGILDIEDMKKHLNMSGADNIPDDLQNKDIFSTKIKSLIGLADARSFKPRIYPINPDATTRIEEARNKKYADHVEALIMKPIVEQVMSQREGQEMTEELQAELQKQIEENTPESIEKYMKRKHQDPLERLASQLFNWILEKEDVSRKASLGWKHALLSARELYLVFAANDNVSILNLDSTRVKYSLSENEEFIENGEWASYYFDATPSRILEMYGDDLSEDDKKDIMNSVNQTDANYDNNSYYDNSSYYDDRHSMSYLNRNTLRVNYVTFRSMMKVGFLMYMDEDGAVEEMMVDENYTFSPENGDINIEWKWVPQIHHGTRIDVKGSKKENFIYVNCEPLPFDTSVRGDMYNLLLPICGGIYDSTNAHPTSIADRLKIWQYMYNGIMWKMEKLIASDQGKKILFDPAMLAQAGIDVEKMQYYMSELNQIPVVKDRESRTQNNTMKDQIDMIDLSLASDINKYIEISEYIKRMAGESIGLPPELEAKISPYMTNGNLNQTMSNATNIMEPYFRMHTKIMANVLELALNAYISNLSKNPDDISIPFILDDMSMEILKIEKEYLNTAIVGLKIENSGKGQRIKEMIEQTSTFALQNQMMSIADIVRIMEEEDYSSAREILEQAEERQHARQRELNERQSQIAAEQAEKDREWEREKMLIDRETKMAVQESKNEADLYRQAILATGFDKDQDMDNNGVRDGVDIMKVALEERKMNLDKMKHDDEMKIKEKELNIKKKESKSKSKQ